MYFGWLGYIHSCLVPGFGPSHMYFCSGRSPLGTLYPIHLIHLIPNPGAWQAGWSAYVVNASARGRPPAHNRLTHVPAHPPRLRERGPALLQKGERRAAAEGVADWMASCALPPARKKKKEKKENIRFQGNKGIWSHLMTMTTLSRRWWVHDGNDGGSGIDGW